MSTVEFIYVAAGGAVGSLLRFVLTLASQRFLGGSSLPGTLIANLLGCLAIGMLITAATLHPQWLSPRAITGIRVGLLGGLTTFSTFAAESLVLANQGKPVVMATYAIGSLVTGLLAVWLGMHLVPGRAAS